MNLWDSYIRWRHSKGYGVHSPFAYKFVTEVLRPGIYGYYAYNQLEALNRNFKEQRSSFFKEARFLIRVAYFLHTKRIITYKIKWREAQIVAKALRLVYSCCESDSNISFKEGDLLILPPDVLEGERVVRNALEKNVPVFAIKPSAEVKNLLDNPIKNGVLFSGSSKMLLIPRSQMEYVAYPIKF